MVDRLERLSDLLFLLLDSPTPLTLNQIRGEFASLPAIAYKDGPSGDRQFEHDKDALRNEGIEIITAHPGGGAPTYEIRAADYYLPELGLTEVEQMALNLAASTVQFDGHSWSESAAWKFGGVAAGAETFGVLRSLDALPLLFDACAAHEAVRFTHAGKTRVLDPWAVMSREGFWYVSGWYHAAEEHRFFRVDRITGDVETAGSALHRAPDGYDARALFPTDPKQVGGTDPTPTEVEIDRVLATKVLAEHTGAEIIERRPDGSLVLRLDVRNISAFRSWLLGMLDHARVLAPASMVDEVVSWLEQIRDAP